jgi:hypothetical protein
VHDPLLVRRVQRVGDLAGGGDRLRRRQGALAEPLSERQSVDQLQDQGSNAGGLLHTVDGGNMRVIQ